MLFVYVIISHLVSQLVVHAFVSHLVSELGVTAEYPATSKLYPWTAWIHGYVVDEWLQNVRI